jgi:hypothetical protein
VKIIQCVECGFEFNPCSPEKRRAGGKINQCLECSEETTVKYAGVQAADGKQSQATILKFQSEQDKNKYLDFWKVTSGMLKGKSCQLSRTAPTTPNIKFKTITSFVPTNHKGKAT